MALIEESELRDVKIISEIEKMAICNYLQGAVYCWCKNRPDEWFAMRDLVGGDNFYWERTPLIVVFLKHRNKLNKDVEDAVKAAAKDSGWLLKKVIIDDKRKFFTKKEGLVRQYKWDGDASY